MTFIFIIDLAANLIKNQKILFTELSHIDIYEYSNDIHYCRPLK